jgi:hypothetical protein
MFVFRYILQINNVYVKSLTKRVKFMNGLNYDANQGLIYHFYQHARFGLSHDIPRFEQPKNWVEKVGDLGLWAIENFPGKVWSLMKEPRWMTIVITNISLASVSYLFYRNESIQALKAVVAYIPVPTREQVKFAAYLTIVAHIVSAAFRAYGRFRNDDLMDSWYAGKDVKDVLSI